MSQPILGLMKNSGPALYYDRLCRLTFESHMMYLRQNVGTTWIAVDPAKALKYQGDLAGFLSSLSWEPQYHWVIMRMNNKNNPTQFGPDDVTLMMPAPSVLRQIESLINTSPNKPK